MNGAIERFQKYLQIPSVHPNVDYGPCVEFLKAQASQIGLPFKTIELVKNKPICIITWTGTDERAKSILLNSHMDVVPVFREHWTYDPFGAEIDANGDIHARGVQDMKCVGMQYLEAIRKLKSGGFRNKRTVHVTFSPDEEIGSVDGMMAFVESPEFRALNVGCGLDEGAASATDRFILMNGERTMLQFKVHCPGSTGHGSFLIPNTAGVKISYVTQKLMAFRAQQTDKLGDRTIVESGCVSCVNLTKLEGGVMSNVLPDVLTATFDVRLTVDVNVDEFLATVDDWCREAGEGVHVEITYKEPNNCVTKLDDSNPYWVAFRSALDDMNVEVDPIICPGVTDARHLRHHNIPAFGFSPMNHTKILLHCHNERLNVDVYLRGIDIYCKIIEKITNV